MHTINTACRNLLRQVLPCTGIKCFGPGGSRHSISLIVLKLLDTTSLQNLNYSQVNLHGEETDKERKKMAEELCTSQFAAKGCSSMIHKYTWHTKASKSSSPQSTVSHEQVGRPCCHAASGGIPAAARKPLLAGPGSWSVV